MNTFSLSDRYRLELHWDQVHYKDGVCTFMAPYFSGPVLQEALKLNHEDHIMLDFFGQYLVLVSSVYVAKFKWKGPKYTTKGRIYFEQATLHHDKELNKVPKLKHNDYLVIDTKGHEVEKHPFNLVYKTYVVNEDTQLYKFGR